MRLILSILIPASWAIQSDWQPIAQPDIFDGIKMYHHQYPVQANIVHGYHNVHNNEGGQCELYKVGFTQDLYFQYIQYKTKIPEMKEFTLCFWTKFSNHTNDHPIFSYAVDGQPKAILSWISNTERSSYFSLAVEGHTFFRLNYPIRLNRWYHTCQSWNGKTGEWQIWVNAERVGRGFHNRLVGHVIPSNGLAITGQQQSQLGGGFLEGHEAPKGSGGMLGEVTMLQLYNVALTAGKAHRDHKHHHAHRYDHNGNQITTPPTTTKSPRPTLPTHPLLTGGQINPQLRLNFAGRQSGQQPIIPGQNQVIPGQNFNVQLINGQIVSNLVSQQLMASQAQQFQPQPQPITFIPTPANVQFIDSSFDSHQLFKRQNKNIQFGDKIKKRQDGEKSKKKRELFIAGGHIVDDTIVGGALDQDDLDGLAGIGENEPILEEQKQNDEREPAEAEVKAVMNVCSGCDEEPFGKALVIGWRTVAKKLYSGAYYLPAVPQCKVF